MTVDTDIGILALYYSLYLQINVYLQLGSGGSIRYLDINENEIEDDVKRALPGLHAFTGCDSTSCFVGKGKVKCHDVMKSDSRYISAFSLLGEFPTVSDSVADVIEEFVCRLYGIKSIERVNESRYELFRHHKSVPEPHRLPPTQDALLLHLKRSNYQTYEWKNALSQHPNRLDITSHGWDVDEENNVTIKWTTKNPAPQSILDFVSCNCQKSNCSNNMCKCRTIKLPCTD